MTIKNVANHVKVRLGKDTKSKLFITFGKFNNMCPKRAYLIIGFVILPLFGCNLKTNEKTKLFLTYIKNEEYDKAKGLMWKGDGTGFDLEITDFYLKEAHKSIMKYGIPPENKWEIKYDTGREKGVFRMIEITIPLYKTKEAINNHDLEYANIFLEYIYKMPFYGDSIFIFNYRQRKKL